jgi:hypothetical protein
MENAVFWLRRVAFVRTDDSEESINSIIRAKRLGELGMLTVTSSRSRELRNVGSYKSYAA